MQGKKSNYWLADEDCRVVIDHCERLKGGGEEIDHELYIDTLAMRGVIRYRLGFAADAVKYFNYSRRVKENFLRRVPRIMK